MRFILRHLEFSFAALLTLLLASAHLRIGFGARQAPPASRLISPSAPVDTVFTVQMKGGMIRVDHMNMKSAKPQGIRGETLRSKGEALGGGMPDRIDVDTGTLVAR